MVTVPDPCPLCGGAGRRVVERSHAPRLSPRWRMLEGVGWDHVHCVTCDGRGTMARQDPPGSFAPPPRPPTYQGTSETPS